MGQAGQDGSRTAQRCWGGTGTQEESQLGDIQASLAQATTRHAHGPSLTVSVTATLDNAAASFNSWAPA